MPENRVLYFIYNRYTGLIKVGVSWNFLGRLAGLECAVGVRLDTLGILDNGADLEGKLHEALFETREVGEWFRPTDELLAIAKAPTRANVVALITAKAPVVAAHFKAVEEATRAENEAAQARKAEEKRIAKEKAKIEAAKKKAKEQRAAERKRAEIEKDAIERHAAMETWKEKGAEILSNSGLTPPDPAQRVRNMQFIGIVGSNRDTQ